MTKEERKRVGVKSLPDDLLEALKSWSFLILYLIIDIKMLR
jgi:hypothetical protein